MIFSGFLEVCIFFIEDNENEYEYIKVKNYCIETSFLENNYLYLHCFEEENYFYERFFNEPFEIHIDVSCDYTPRIEEVNKVLLFMKLMKQGVEEWRKQQLMREKLLNLTNV